MQSFRAIVFIVMSLVFTPLLAQKVAYDWDKDVDFTVYRTYKWVEVESGKSAVETTHKRILNNVDVQLQAKGVKLARDGNADLYVGYQIVTDKKGQIASFNPDGQWNPGTGMGANTSKPSAGTVAQGSLIIDIYDREMKKLIWRGIVSAAFDSRQAVNYAIENGLSKLFINYPPPVSK
jgi:hypothetical protein